ncbi:MAG: hypothetical protein L3K14_02095 [Thermoplasmata archaeon]|nr:hypothetical protein [Thermoplasmata archaeon]
MVDWLSPAIILPEDHAVIGALAVAVAYALAPGRLGDLTREHPRVPRGAVAAFALVVLFKELLWDPANEVDQPFLSAGVTDLSWYFVGMGAMLGALWARFRRL